LELKIVYSLAY